MKKLSTDPYKGVRDFYPDDMAIQNYIFETWRKVSESFGYKEYSASILEPAELYLAKSGEEIVNNETYTFVDRGDREVTLRPEMTPTVARMVAARKTDLSYPLRWFSIPNLFRYEKPQRGRLREHWQLNVDIFGVNSFEAEVEIISVGSAIMKKFGAKKEDFQIRINNRKILNDFFEKLLLSEEDSHKLSKIIDKKAKLPKETFEILVEEILKEKTKDFLESTSSNQKLKEFLGKDNQNILDLQNLIQKLSNVNIKNVVFDPTLMRGFDYYTGTVFEMYDTDPKNPRAIFGGGRYDNLLLIFDAPKVSAVGFGLGDVTLRDFLETHDLLPKNISKIDISLCMLSSEYFERAQNLAETLRARGLSVSVDLSFKKIGEQIKSADKNKIPFVLIIGENEISSGLYSLKNMQSGEERKVAMEEIMGLIKNNGIQ